MAKYFTLMLFAVNSIFFSFSKNNFKIEEINHWKDMKVWKVAAEAAVLSSVQCEKGANRWPSLL